LKKDTRHKGARNDRSNKQASEISMTENRIDKTISRLVASRSNNEAKEIYHQWQSYDSDLDQHGYVAPQIAVDKLVKILDDKNALIHDAGCGTGKVGVLLNQAGFTRIEGSDLSESMLQRAENHTIYNKLSVADFSTSLDEADKKFDAAISVGVWKDSFGPSFTKELVRITKTGGIIIMTVRPQFFPALESVLQELQNERSIDVISNDIDDYMTGQQAKAHFIALSRLS